MNLSDVKIVKGGVESFMVSFDFTKTPVTQIADYIIIAASKHKASDIHFDPREDGMMVRFRIDGDCQDYTFVPKAYEKNLTTRLKLLANMNITESRLPQDGAIKGDFGGTYLDMRVSSLPLNEGEKIVIRILDYTRSKQGIESLGFHPDNLKKVKRMMEIPNGIILTTGATGSGKSTTTYSILQELNKPEKNIITVEDPIEMNIEGINQVQVNAEIGMTFAAALRSILRQDPNIILIGEIRDSETAQIAVRASITGHLVLSTIHTNNALSTVERLLDMNVERYLLSTALTGIISQRLAKMLCPHCRFKRDTTPYEKKVFKKFMHMDVEKLWDANPKGCENCRNGYHGRLAFHEVLELDDDIRAALNNPNISKKELSKMVYTGKTITMLQDALIKCYNGKTSFEEVYRNIEIETEEESDDIYENEISDFLKKIISNNNENDNEVIDNDNISSNKNINNNLSNKVSNKPETIQNYTTILDRNNNNYKVASAQANSVVVPNANISNLQNQYSIPNKQQNNNSYVITNNTNNLQSNNTNINNNSIGKVPTNIGQNKTTTTINNNKNNISIPSYNNTNNLQSNNTNINKQINNTISNSKQNNNTFIPKVNPNYLENINKQNNNNNINTNKIVTIPTNINQDNINKQKNISSIPPVYNHTNTLQNYYSNTGYTHSTGQVSPISPTISIPSQNKDTKK